MAFCCWIALLYLASMAVATAAPAKRALGYEVFEPGAWRHVARPVISDNGRTLVYELLADFDGESPMAPPPELVLRDLDTHTEQRITGGRNARVSQNGAQVIFEVGAETAGSQGSRSDGARSSSGPFREKRIASMTVATGAMWKGPPIASFQVPHDFSTRVAYLTLPTGGAKETSAQHGSGSTLIVRDLVSGGETAIENVTEYLWAASGAELAYVVSARVATSGVYLRRARDGVVRRISREPGEFVELAIDHTGKHVAFLGSRTGQGPDEGLTLFHWTGTMSAAEATVRKGTRGLPDGHVVVATGKASTEAEDAGHLLFSADGRKLFFGTAPLSSPKRSTNGALQVDVWHWRDELLQREQQRNAELTTAYRAVLYLDERKVVPLESPDLWLETRFIRPIGPLANLRMDPWLTTFSGNYGIGVVEGPGRFERSWRADARDYVLVDLTSGSRRSIVQGHRNPIPRLSPNGKYVVYFEPATLSWHSLRCADGHRVDLAKALADGAAFAERDDWAYGKQPNGLWVYGLIDFTAGDRSVLLRGRHDVWEVDLEGRQARNVTLGIGERRRLAFFSAAYQPRPVSRAQPLLLRAVDERTLATGFFRVDLKRGTSTQLVMMDKLMGLPREGREETGMRGRSPNSVFLQARNMDRALLSIQRFDEVPDLWHMDTRSGELERVSDTNPQRRNYLWGRAELLHYQDEQGRELRASVFKPGDFDPARKYPLLLSIYEQEGGALHVFESPTVSYPPGNVARYVSRGYVVMKPDIVYQPGRPGDSALRSVTAAVRAILAQGFVDPKRIGIGGHSFGGYETAYIITHTNLFRAAISAGAASNLVSLYEQQQLEGGRAWAESSQGRLRESAWENPQLYIENSPIFKVRDVTTPLLIVHNDADYVSWNQGREFFEALRRYGKEAYLFNYNGEGHGVVKPQNVRHFVLHSDEFFDHYLLGADEPKWMEEGVPYAQRGSRDLTPFFGPSASLQLIDSVSGGG